MLVYQRVNLHFPMLFLCFSYAFPMVFLWFSHLKLMVNVPATTPPPRLQVQASTVTSTVLPRFVGSEQWKNAMPTLSGWWFQAIEGTLWLCQNSYWKWPFIVDLPIEKWWFSIAMLNYRRVNLSIRIIDSQIGLKCQNAGKTTRLPTRIPKFLC